MLAFVCFVERKKLFGKPFSPGPRGSKLVRGCSVPNPKISTIEGLEAETPAVERNGGAEREEIVEKLIMTRPVEKRDYCISIAERTPRSSTICLSSSPPDSLHANARAGELAKMAA